MPDKPFHHGNLRSVLLARAEQTLRSSGIDALSLRELARQAGVSHGAPRRHFADRQALLDALAEQGFVRLTDQMTDADDRDASYRARFRAVAAAFVGFAISDAALLDLMFTAQSVDPPASLVRATERFFVASRDIVRQGHAAGYLPLEDPQRLHMLLVATLQGIATLVATGRLPAEQVDTLIEDAATLFISDPADPADPADRGQERAGRRATPN